MPNDTNTRPTVEAPAGVVERAVETVAKIEMDREGLPLSRTLEEVYGDATETVQAVLAAITQPQGEVDELVERLRDFRCANCGWEGALTDGAADSITTQAAEIAALREALNEAATFIDRTSNYVDARPIIDRARALLEPEAGK